MACISRSTQCSEGVSTVALVRPALHVEASMLHLRFWSLISGWLYYSSRGSVESSFSTGVQRLLTNEWKCACLREAEVHHHPSGYGSSPAISVTFHRPGVLARRLCPLLILCASSPKRCASTDSQHQTAISSALSPVHSPAGLSSRLLTAEKAVGSRGRVLPNPSRSRSRNRQGY